MSEAYCKSCRGKGKTGIFIAQGNSLRSPPIVLLYTINLLPLFVTSLIAVFSLILRFVNFWSSDIKEKHLIMAMTALALIIDTEDFKTFKREHIGEDDRDVLVSMGDEEWLDDICDDDKVRRKIRPVLDMIRESRRMRK